MSEPFVALWHRAQAGDHLAHNTLYQLAFQRLRTIASALLRRESAGHTLQPTALVSELFLKLHRFESRLVDEDHFFRIAARAMRQVLIDRGRAKRARSSPDEVRHLLFASRQDATACEDTLAVRLIFEKLRTMDRRTADTVWLRTVEGLTVPELSRLQRREEWKVRADYDFGLRWMANHLTCD
ncbi:MAG: hypothetical protein IT168_32095 [Bryobacterales bacterium]|nr:hypothetical protein [Bryobacterales bacterium]